MSGRTEFTGKEAERIDSEYGGGIRVKRMLHEQGEPLGLPFCMIDTLVCLWCLFVNYRLDLLAVDVVLVVP
uniref:hypothetical protein n=1 Tax=Peribacillus simplex TaxID=1478 RepID=UPI001C86B5DC